MATEDWTVERARELYNLEGWGIGYFDVNERGHLTVLPSRDPGRALDLYELALDLAAQGVGLPLLLRFSDILRSRIEGLSERFRLALEEAGQGGGYTLVYPIKVNQQRHVVEEIVEFGRSHGVGLEVGSKPELMAALALGERSDYLIVCNGYKDEEFIRLALMGMKLGHQVFVVLEKIGEVDTLLKVADEMGVEPAAGVRVKLASSGAGRWSESAGERSKFGLGPAQLVRVLEKLAAAGRLDALRLIHFHLGSQIPDILSVKTAMSEVARYYAELHALGVVVTHVDVGGGLGVDYDGSRSTAAASVNYSIQEYANDIVYALADVCRERGLPMPHIISESGRALTAHHALLLTGVIDRESHAGSDAGEVSKDAHPLVRDLAETVREIGAANVRESYHDASFAKEQAHQLFVSGVLGLGDRAAVERLHATAMNRLQREAGQDPEEYADLIAEIEVALTDRYFCNFSLFQSLPDSWAIDQLFPIMPIHRLDEEPDRRGTLQDVTCDSDGKIDRFTGWGRDLKRTLELHSLRPGEPYILGIFLTGAYQEILGDMHNLFGDTNAVHVRLSAEGYEIGDLVRGDTTTEVLEYVQFDARSLVAAFRRKVRGAETLSRGEANAFIADYLAGLAGYTYLE
ncbi:MAG: biosynthetic arginine decarboxylase [Longimicrobiaceae bacterium]